MIRLKTPMNSPDRVPFGEFSARYASASHLHTNLSPRAALKATALQTLRAEEEGQEFAPAFGVPAFSAPLSSDGR